MANTYEHADSAIERLTPMLRSIVDRAYCQGIQDVMDVLISLPGTIYGDDIILKKSDIADAIEKKFC